jgi:WD40 repeat protein
MGIAFSPTANILAVAGPTNATTLWSVPDGKLLAVLRAKPTSPNTAVAFSPDGKTLAVGDADRSVRLWAVPEGRDVGVLPDHDGWVHSLSFSPDGKMLAVYAGQLKFWRLPEMRALPLFPELRGLEETSTPGHPGMLSPDGKFFAYLRSYAPYFSGSSGYALEIIILSLENKKTIRIECVGCLSFTFGADSSKLIATGQFGGLGGFWLSPIRIWNAVTGERIR